MLLLLSIHRLYQSTYESLGYTYTLALGDFHETIEYFCVFSVDLSQLLLLLVLKCSHLIHVYVDLSLNLPIGKQTHGLHLAQVRNCKRHLFLLPPKFLFFYVDFHKLSAVLSVEPAL